MAIKQVKSTAEIALQKGKYRVEATLNRGEFGITYQGHSVPLRQAVAIKTLRPSLRHHTHFAQYYHHFRSVSQCLIQCQHPHLVQVIDLFEEKGLPFMVMDYIHGHSLAERLQSRPRFSINQALDSISQIASALMVIHQQGLLHCNLEPQTILQCSSRQTLTLVDFGINSSFIDQTSQPYRGNRNLPGGFAALEQYFPHEKLTPATDVYGLAALFYYLLTGQSPLEAPRMASQTTASWFSQVQPALKQQHPDLSPSIEQMILWGLAVQHSDRPQTIDQWLALIPHSETLSPQMELSRMNASLNPSEDPTLNPTQFSHLPHGQVRFLSQLLGLRWSIPMVFVITAVVFGWLGFSLTRQYTQVIVKKVGQQIRSDQLETDWSGETFSDYDPSKPMFEKPSVKTRVIEPDPWEEEYNINTKDDEFEKDLPQQYEAEEFSSEWESDTRQDEPGDFQSAPATQEPDYGEYQQRLTPNYNSDPGYQEDSSDTYYSSPTYPHWTQSYESDPQESNLETSGYASEENYNYSDDYHNNNDYSQESDYSSDYQDYTVPEPVESATEYNASNESEWNRVDQSPSQESSPWTPEPTIDPELDSPSQSTLPDSSNSWQPPAAPYSSSSSVELSIPETSESFSQFDTDAPLPSSGFGVEEISVPTSVSSEGAEY